MNCKVIWRTTDAQGKPSGSGRMILTGVESTEDAAAAAEFRLKHLRLVRPHEAFGLVIKDLPDSMTQKQEAVACAAVCAHAWLAVTPLIIFIPSAIWAAGMLLFWLFVVWQNRREAKRSWVSRMTYRDGIWKEVRVVSGSEGMRLLEDAGHFRPKGRTTNEGRAES